MTTSGFTYTCASVHVPYRRTHGTHAHTHPIHILRQILHKKRLILLRPCFCFSIHRNLIEHFRCLHYSMPSQWSAHTPFACCCCRCHCCCCYFGVHSGACHTAAVQYHSNLPLVQSIFSSSSTYRYSDDVYYMNQSFSSSHRQQLNTHNRIRCVA